MTGVEADETVAVVAPCIMGTFIQASQTKDKGCGRGGGGTGMIWLPWQKGQNSWHKSSDIARMSCKKYKDMQKKRDKENYIFN